MRARWILPALLALAGPAQAVTLDLPTSAVLTAQVTEVEGSLDVPLGPWSDNGMEELEVEGAVVLTAWRVRGRATSLQLLAPLREQLQAAGYEILYECDTDDCGGFDFRYDLRVLAEPEMHVDLGDFRFLSAIRRDADGIAPEYVCLLVSRASESGFVHLAHVGPPGTEPVQVASSSKTPVAEPLQAYSGDLSQRLEAEGATSLEDLNFASGSSELSEGKYASLDALAVYLKANPERAVTIVGHTDAVGSLSANIALSKRRAQSVMERLISRYGVRRVQVAAEGVGYLAPRASNLDQTGRTQNRRVEVMLTSTD